MGLGYTYTVIPARMPAPPAMTGHAAREEDARAIVEELLGKDGTLACGTVRNLADDAAAVLRCRRSREPGQFFWSAVTAAAAPVWS